MDILENSVKLVSRFLNGIDSYLNIFLLKEYFRCRSNGRFVDPYHCAQGEYFECIHYQQGLIFN
jgi:hypothetical protein